MLRSALFTLFALFTFIGCARPVHAEPAAAAQHSYLLDYAVQIMIISQEADGPSANAALGTLVMNNGQHAVLTHGHWPSIHSGTATELRVISLSGQLLAQISAQSLFATMLHNDEGSLLFAAPAELINAGRFAQIGQVDRVQPNAQLQIIYTYVNESGTSVFTMRTVVVEHLADHNGLPIFQFRGMDGQIIKPGNSGGSVYLNGQIVGNIWGTVATADGTLTNHSIAATVTAHGQVAQLAP